MRSRRSIPFVIALGLSLAAPAAAEESGFLGVLLSQETVNLAPPLDGRLKEVRVRIGDTVTRGAVVALLDDRVIRQELNKAEANLEEAQAARTEAAARLSMAKDTMQRRQQLPAELISQEEVRAAVEEERLARAGVEIAEARVRQQQAQLQQSRDKLAQSRLTSPFDGTVAARYGDPGQMVGPDTPVVRLISSQGLRVRFAVPLERASSLSRGGAVEIRVPSLQLTVPGAVRQIGSEVDPASGMIFCEASVEPPDPWDGPALPGRTVRVAVAAD